MTTNPEVQTETLRDTSPWMTKAAAARELNCSERTIENYVAERKLASRRQAQAGRRPLTLVNPHDVSRLKAEQNRGVLLTAPTQTPAKAEPRLHELAVADTLPRAVDLLAKLAAQRVPKPYMTLAEASEYTGLPEGLLKRFIKRGELPRAVFKGQTYLRTADVAGLELELLVPREKRKRRDLDLSAAEAGLWQ